MLLHTFIYFVILSYQMYESIFQCLLNPSYISNHIINQRRSSYAAQTISRNTVPFQSIRRNSSGGAKLIHLHIEEALLKKPIRDIRPSTDMRISSSVRPIRSTNSPTLCRDIIPKKKILLIKKEHIYKTSEIYRRLDFNKSPPKSKECRRLIIPLTSFSLLHRLSRQRQMEYQTIAMVRPSKIYPCSVKAKRMSMLNIEDMNPSSFIHALNNFEKTQDIGTVLPNEGTQFDKNSIGIGTEKEDEL